MRIKDKAPPAGAADGIAACLDAIVEAFARRNAVLPLDAGLVEQLREVRERVGAFVSDTLRRDERHAEEVAGLRSRLTGVQRDSSRACREIADLAEQRDIFSRGRDEQLTRARVDGERAADDRYRNAAAGNAVLEAFVDATRLRSGEDLAKRWAERKAARTHVA